MYVVRKGELMHYTLDLHGFQIAEAKKHLDHYINKLPKQAVELTIIHGYQAGISLQQFIRKQYHHKRLQRIILTMNPGETILVLT